MDVELSPLTGDPITGLNFCCSWEHNSDQFSVPHQDNREADFMAANEGAKGYHSPLADIVPALGVSTAAPTIHDGG